jgi:putative Holliday junction resolvase
MNILGIDYGDKRIGLAVASDDWIKPIGIIKNNLLKKVASDIEEVVARENISKIVIGLPVPLRKNGDNERSLKTKSFGAFLKSTVSIPIDFSSEIFTSKLASFFSYTKMQKKSIDTRAACFILENYLKKSTHE